MNSTPEVKRKAYNAALGQSYKERLLLKQEWKCCWCGGFVPWRGATIEHIIPVSLGGTWALKNLAVSHRYCNSKRGARTDADPHWSSLFGFVRERLRQYRDGEVIAIPLKTDAGEIVGAMIQ
jgi:5-methylcytosine-specific restriction endonuclease McrA